jgi:hypothetical protein
MAQFTLLAVQNTFILQATSALRTTSAFSHRPLQEMFSNSIPHLTSHYNSVKNNHVSYLAMTTFVGLKYHHPYAVTKIAK